jgi:hypothetical protein
LRWCRHSCRSQCIKASPHVISVRARAQGVHCSFSTHPRPEHIFDPQLRKLACAMYAFVSSRFRPIPRPEHIFDPQLRKVPFSIHNCGPPAAHVVEQRLDQGVLGLELHPEGREVGLQLVALLNDLAAQIMHEHQSRARHGSSGRPSDPPFCVRDVCICRHFAAPAFRDERRANTTTNVASHSLSGQKKKAPEIRPRSADRSRHCCGTRGRHGGVTRRQPVHPQLDGLWAGGSHTCGRGSLAGFEC